MTKSGYLKSPSKDLILFWLIEAWDNIDGTMIRNAFEFCGITTKLGDPRIN